MDNTFYPPHLTPPRYPFIRRTLAALLDYAFVILIVITFYRFVDLPSSAERVVIYRGAQQYFGFGFMFWFLYFPFIEFVFGATIGKWLFGLVVKSKDRSRPLINQNLKRHLLDIVDVFYFNFAFLKDQRNPELQRLGDKWAGTVVKRAAVKRKDNADQIN